MTKPNPFLLSRDIEPLRYSIELEPDLNHFTFHGKETIRIRTDKPFSKIELHAIELNITQAIGLRGDLETGSKYYAKCVSFNDKRETVIIDFGVMIKPGQISSLYLEFDGILNDKMHGFYRTSYEVDGVKRWGAATQFEATDARRAFPCWDEPDRKAEFEIALRVPQHLTALSNMPILEEEVLSGTGLKCVVYDVTPKMPTYLVAVVIADLEYLEAWDKNGVLVRVYTTPGKREQGQFALDVALHTLPYFTDWFGVPYCLPKCDMVALPDFAAGAMENWGLVTYRETALLVDPVNSSAAARQRVAEVVDHELAHQWFGNLVTMKWWTDLWLNEGFASYMGPKAVAHQFPKWKVWNQYIANEYLSALHADALKNTHPIEIEVEDPCEIREIFDTITYSKGSVVNRMLEHYLTEEKFREGLGVYLKRYEFGNARTEDLWSALEEVSGKPVKAIMASFTKQGGYPILSVEDKSKNGKMVLSLVQKRFLFDGSAPKANEKWNIPIGVTAAGLKEPYFSVMKTSRESVSLPLNGRSGKSWIKINPGQSGFYRTSYSAKLFDRLTQALNSPAISSIDYLGILDDAFALTRAGHLRTSRGLALLESAKCHAADYNVWATASGVLAQTETIFCEGNKALSDRLSAFARSLFWPILAKMGWTKKPKDSHLDILLRSLVIGNLGFFGDSRVIEEAKKRFANFVKTGNLDPDLRGVVYSQAARYGGPREFKELVALYKKSQLQEEKVRVLRALTRFRDTDIIKQVLDFSLSEDVRSQDTYVLLAGFGSNPVARKTAWHFVKSNWEMLVSRYSGGGVSMLGRILEGSTTGFASPDALADVKKFFKSNPIPGTERTMKQSLEIIQSNIAWSRRDREDVSRWLEFSKKSF